MLTNGFGWPHVLIILAILVIFFGARRLPDAARGIGRSMRVFRSEMRGMGEDDAPSSQAGSAARSSESTQAEPGGQGPAAVGQLTPPPPVAPQAAAQPAAQASDVPRDHQS